MNKLLLLASLLIAASRAFSAQTATLTADTESCSPSGGTVTFTATANYTGTPSAIGWSVQIPAGWSYVSGTGEPGVRPTPGRISTLEWAYISVPANTSSFTFTVAYPAGVITAQTFVPQVIVRAGTTATLTPAVVTLNEGAASGVAPTITSGATANATANQPFTYAITATSDSPISAYSASGLPSGVSLNATTGVISGSPTVTGTFSISLGATNASGSASATLLLSVAAATNGGGGSKSNQTIAFDPLPSTKFSGASLGLSASASSGLPVAFSVVAGPASIAGGMLKLSGAGTVTVRAAQAGSSSFNAAPSVDRSFEVAKADLTVTALDQSRPYGAPNPTLTLTYAGFVGTDSPASLLSVPVATTQVNPLTPPGRYTIGVAGGAAANYTLHYQTGDLVIQPAPIVLSHTSSGGATLLPDISGAAAMNVQWMRNGRVISGATNPGLAIPQVSAADVGIYVLAPSSSLGSPIGSPSVVGVVTNEKITGSASEVGSSILHPNGNVFDQMLLQGHAATLKADFDRNEITRISFIDLTNDIVQVEFSGPGTLSLVLDSPPDVPATPSQYNQNVEYVRGHAGIVITGATEHTNVSVFSVGRATAVDQSLFRNDVTYNGYADIAFIAISSANGNFGGIRTGNASYFATRGFTGVYAPGVHVRELYIENVTAFDHATPAIVVGSAADARITGGDLAQENGAPIQVSGITSLQFTAGTDSHGRVTPAAANQGTLLQEGRDVTAQITGTKT